MTNYPCGLCSFESKEQPVGIRRARVYLQLDAVGYTQCQEHFKFCSFVAFTEPRDGFTIPFVLEEPAPQSLPSVAPYASNPERRLRRLRRWIKRCDGYIPQSSSLDSASEFESELGFERRVEANRLFSIELEWACKTAMESIGGKW